MEGEKIISIHGKELIIQYAPSDTRTAIASIRQNRILIRIPHRWPAKDRAEAAEKLERRILKKLSHPETKRNPLPPMSREEKRKLVREVLPNLQEKVEALNTRYFQATLGTVRIRSNISTWGSCSPQNNISINFALLFLPAELLDYVIVHELAHTQRRDHSREFWQQVERAMPDYKARKKELRRYMLAT